ncbi:MAG: amidophosphoribosyltransferase [Clostridiales bacterium]|nr:MAG: amidophosphoribosyltransferase [Clostridiales bacterium]
MGKIKEACGVFGIYARSESINVSEEAYLALFALQHRGQESCGIAVANNEDINSYRDLGLVPDVFNPMVMNHLSGGNIAIGHTHYGIEKTKGSSRENAQPLVSKYKKGAVALAYNGAIANADELHEELQQSGAIFQTNSDCEILLYVLAKERLSCHCLEDAVMRLTKKVKGAYSMVVMTSRKLIAVRDKTGFRPLCMGELEDGSVIFASESCAIDTLGAKFVRDIEPGEVVVVDERRTSSYKNSEQVKSGACIFEYIYFARPDSIIDGASVHEARKQAGRFLAEEHPVDADIVCGVPDSGLDAALGYSEQSGIPYGVAFIKNRYIGRTFIQPTQGQRERAVQIKLNALKAAVDGKRVVLIDDSIVRGTTIKNTIRLLKDSGAKEVHLRISSPPFKNPCYFGTDIASREFLISCRMTETEICEYVGADSLGYLGIENVDKIAKGAKVEFCKGCFTGKYPIEVKEEK